MPDSGLDATETLRLVHLHEYAVLDTPEEQVFDNITSLAASLCLVPMSAISFMDQHRHWFKSRFGPIPDREIARTIAGLEILPEGRQLLEIRDIRADERFAALVKLHPDIAFFAAIPLVSSEGWHLGHLCVLDTRIRRLFSLQRSALEKLASTVVALLEAKKKEHRMVQLGSLLDRSNNEIFLWDAESLRILHANRGACRNLQYSLAELRQMAPWDLNPRYTPGFLEATLAPLKTGQVSHRDFEGSLRRKDGSCYPVDVRLEISREWEAAQIVAIVTDITARKQAEARLEENRQSYQSLFDHNPFPVFSLDLTGRFVSYNLACVRLAGYAENEYAHLSFEHLVVPEARQRVRRHIQQACQGHAQGYECSILHKNGQLLTLAVTHLPIVVNDQITGVYGIARDISERKQAEEALRESEERFRATFEQAAVGIAQTRMDGTFFSVNQKLCDITGYCQEELTGMTFQQITHPDEMAMSLSHLARMSGGGLRHFSRQKRYIHKSGQVIWANLTVSLCHDSQDRPSHFITVVEDISARIWAEQALRESQQRLELAVRAAGLGIWEWDLETDGIWCSPKTAEHLCGDAAIRIASLEDFLVRVHPDDRPLIQAAHQKALNGDGRLSVEYRVTWPNQEVRWLAVQAQAMVPNRRILGVSMDISERKHAEAALRHSEEQYRITFEAAPVGIATLDAEGRWLRVNQKMCEITGYSAEELRLMSFYDISYPDDRDAGAEQRSQMLDQHIPGYTLEKRYVHKNGEIIWVSVTANALHDAQGRLLYSMVSLEDITRRKQYEQSLRELSSHLQTVRESERTRIAREIHDELGGTLTAIKFDLSLAKHPAQDPAQAERQAGTVKLVDDAISALRRIITDLRPSILDNLGLWAALEWQAQEFQARMGIACRFRMQLQELIQLDPDRSTAIFRIFQETLTNVARHANATDVQVHVTANRQETVIKVVDNGRGITRAQIQQPRSYGILGMRERARAYNGSIRFSSGQGGGTTVLIRFPAG